jgi:site-specific recombinase XerD
MSDDPDVLQEFAQSLASRDPKTVKAYQSAMCGFIRWLTEQPGGDPFSPDKITETAIRSYLDYLAIKGRAPRTRSQALTALSRFCRWAISTGYLQHNPASQVQRPTVINIAPRELTPAQRYSLRKRVEREQSPRLSAIFTLGYWAGV